MFVKGNLYLRIIECPPLGVAETKVDVEPFSQEQVDPALVGGNAVAGVLIVRDPYDRRRLN